MKSSENNPDSNVFGPGVSEQLVNEAISYSGYPLQVIVAKELATNFLLREEWSYVDPDTNATRTIDILATRDLYEYKEPQPRIRPSINFIIECKQSELPYVFFLSQGNTGAPHFPVVCGLGCEEIRVFSDDDPSTWNFSPISLFELHDHPFLRSEPTFCMTFSKCMRKGSKLQLSGSEPYQNLIFPILKSVDHFKNNQEPADTAFYFDCHLVIGLGIIDAPMVGVNVTEKGNDTKLIPWVRVVRHQPYEGVHKYDRSRVYAIDIIHKDFLKNYLDHHAMPFAEEFSKLCLKHADILAEGKGFIPGMGKDGWHNLEPRLNSLTLGAKKKRYRTIIKRIVDFISRGKVE